MGKVEGYFLNSHLATSHGALWRRRKRRRRRRNLTPLWLTRTLGAAVVGATNGLEARLSRGQRECKVARKQAPGLCGRGAAASRYYSTLPYPTLPYQPCAAEEQRLRGQPAHSIASNRNTGNKHHNGNARARRVFACCYASLVCVYIYILFRVLCCYSRSDGLKLRVLAPVASSLLLAATCCGPFCFPV